MIKLIGPFLVVTFDSRRPMMNVAYLSILTPWRLSVSFGVFRKCWKFGYKYVRADPDDWSVNLFGLGPFLLIVWG